MSSLDETLKERLDALRSQNLLRELRRVDSAQGPRIQVDGRTLLNFSSNDYLGLASHPALKKAAKEAVENFGAGAGASRLVCGSLAPFHELEETLAAFKGTEAALSFSTGYATALGTICALLGRNDVIILDKLVHACIVDAARLCGAKIRVFDHNDLADLEKTLQWADTKHRKQNPAAKILIATESVFSMDGDCAPLREIVALKEKYGAWLMVDEAHATGILGRDGRGLADELGVAGRIEIQMGTLGKALGASGGYVCGSRLLVDYLVNRARSFIFSTAPVPAAAAAATAAIKLIQSSEGKTRRDALRQRIAELDSAMARPHPGPLPQERGNRTQPRGQARTPHSALRTPQSAIIPLILGSEEKALTAAAKLREKDIFVPAIRYPTVARGTARLRITLTAAHSANDTKTLVTELQLIGNRQSAIGN